MSQTTVSLSPDELEVLVRRVVREELTRLLRSPVRSILEDWRQEGLDDPAEKEIKDLPGHVRAQARQLIRALGQNPRPARAKSTPSDAERG